MSLIEIIGSITGLLSVWLAARQNWLTWPIGMVNIVMFIILFYYEKLYPDVLLHIVYLILAIYGWIQWEPKKLLSVSKINYYLVMAIILFITLISFLVSIPLSLYTDTAYPFADSLVTGLSLVACYLMSRKIINSWIIYIISDIIAITIYCDKQLYIIAALYFVYLLLCIKGYKLWKKSLQ